MIQLPRGVQKSLYGVLCNLPLLLYGLEAIDGIDKLKAKVDPAQLERVEKWLARLLQKAREEEREQLKIKIGMLRQWLNERNTSNLVTNEELEAWLLDPTTMIQLPQDWHEMARALAKNIKIYSGKTSCPMCGVDPLEQLNFFEDFVAKKLQKARKEERKRIKKAIIGMWHRGEVVSYRIDSEFAGIAVPISKVLGLLAPTPVTSSESK